ncbi:MAG: 5-deoxy-glucuronate isomerase [Nitrososphaeria archaeon]|jgi:5-deoxy-glucuronate isomerase
MIFKWLGWRNNRTDVLDGQFNVSVITAVDKLKYDEELNKHETVVCPLKGGAEILLGESEKLSLAEKDCAAIQGVDSVKIMVTENSILTICKGNTTSRRLVTKVEPGKVQGIITGGDHYRRNVRVLFGPESPLESLIVGLTEAEPGNWTGYPPHRHDDKPEVYVYYGLGDGFGLQLEWTDKEQKVHMIGDYDAFLAKECYHPNVAPPPFPISYIWFMYAENPSKKNLNAYIHPKLKFIPGGATHLTVK